MKAAGSIPQNTIGLHHVSGSNNRGTRKRRSRGKAREMIYEAREEGTGEENGEGWVVAWTRGHTEAARTKRNEGDVERGQ